MVGAMGDEGSSKPTRREEIKEAIRRSDPPDRAAKEALRKRLVVEALKKKDEKLVDELSELLAERWGEDRKCPYCDHSDWVVAKQLLQIERLRDGRPQPFFGVWCEHCGNTVLVEPDSIDLWPSEP